MLPKIAPDSCVVRAVEACPPLPEQIVFVIWCERLRQVKILAIDDGVPPKTATATLTVSVQDINDNAPKCLRDYRPVLQEHLAARKVVEVLAPDDDDRSKSNGPPFTFRLDPNAGDVIKASFKVEHDQSECYAARQLSFYLLSFA